MHVNLTVLVLESAGKASKKAGPSSFNLPDGN